MQPLTLCTSSRMCTLIPSLPTPLSPLALNLGSQKCSALWAHMAASHSTNMWDSITTPSEDHTPHLLACVLRYLIMWSKEGVCLQQLSSLFCRQLWRIVFPNRYIFVHWYDGLAWNSWFLQGRTVSVRCIDVSVLWLMVFLVATPSSPLDQGWGDGDHWVHQTTRFQTGTCEYGNQASGRP